MKLLSSWNDTWGKIYHVTRPYRYSLAAAWLDDLISSYSQLVSLAASPRSKCGLVRQHTSLPSSGELMVLVRLTLALPSTRKWYTEDKYLLSKMCQWRSSGRKRWITWNINVNRVTDDRMCGPAFFPSSWSFLCKRMYVLVLWFHEHAAFIDSDYLPSMSTRTFCFNSVSLPPLVCSAG